MIPVALTIAGSDPSGGAGIQADLKTFHRFRVYGQAVITLLTVQNTRGVSAVKMLEADFLIEQLDAVLADIPPQAAKTGALGSAEAVRALAHRAGSFLFPLIVDPVMVSKHGAMLAAPDTMACIGELLLPCAFLVTPNLPEAAVLTGRAVETLAQMRDAASALCDRGARSALVKGGHLGGLPIDVLCDGGELYEFAAERIATGNTHGTGCAYAAAITALLAGGSGVPAAVAEAKRFVTRAIASNPGLGGGAGPLNFFA